LQFLISFFFWFGLVWFQSRDSRGVISRDPRSVIEKFEQLKEASLRGRDVAELLDADPEPALLMMSGMSPKASPRSPRSVSAII
jgi:hypothetical protein